MTHADPKASPARFPLGFDPHSRAVQWITLDEAQYRAASFLDERLLQGGPAPAWSPWATAQAAAPDAARRADFIFHIGHVGSTLLSRLLGEHPAVMSLREPAVLRLLAQAQFAQDAGRPLPHPGGFEAEGEVLLRLVSRTWRPEQTALIKATSFVSGLAGRLLARTPGARAIFMTVSPMAYLRGILGGPARSEAPALAPLRLERLSLRLGRGLAPPETEGEVIAMAWLCEMMALSDADRAHPGAGVWLDFDQMLAAPQAALAAAFAHLGHAADPAMVQALVESPILKRYSKATDHAYTAQTRREVLLAAERAHGVEVRRGVDWLRRTAEAYPPVKQLLIAAAAIRL